MSNSPNSDKTQGVGNTILPQKKYRSWCFTINNHTTKIWNSLTQLENNIKINKIIFQEETGSNKNLHIQGVVQFENQIQFNTLKELYPTAHWENCKSIKASIKYCSKNKTRTGKQYSYGVTKKEKWKKRKTEDEIIVDLGDFRIWNLKFRNEMSFDKYQEIIRSGQSRG